MLSKKIKLYWYRHNEGHGNFGDALNPYIIEELTGQSTTFVDIYYFGLSPILFFKTLTYDFFNNKLSLVDYLKYIYYFISKPKILVSIGSILQLVKSENILVWGAGVISKDVTKFANATFLAVRGKYTQEVIKKQGYLPPDTIGDPALLLPLVFEARENKRFRLGIIPHFIHYKEFKELSSKDILVINLLEPIEKIIQDINSCEITLSTSLHGIIVSHAYKVPSLWVKSNKKKLDGDDIKFKDYFSSVKLNFYEPKYLSTDLVSDEKIREFINCVGNEKLLPDIEIIKELQSKLLNSFPYRLKDKFDKHLL